MHTTTIIRTVKLSAAIVGCSLFLRTPAFAQYDAWGHTIQLGKSAGAIADSISRQADMYPTGGTVETPFRNSRFAFRYHQKR